MSEKNGVKGFISVSFLLSATESISNDGKSWYMDSGATHHETGNLNLMPKVKSLKETMFVKIGDASKLEAVSIN